MAVDHLCRFAQRLAAPLTDPQAIAARHDAVAHFAADATARADARARLHAAPDLARALTRLVVGRGGPRDLAAIRDGISAAAGLSVLAHLEDLVARGAVVTDGPASITGTYRRD